MNSKTAEPALGWYTLEMAADSVIEDFWYGPKNPSRRDIGLALCERLDYADREGYYMPGPVSLESTIDVVLERLAISYINQ